jgi:hypothetical protein
VVQTHNYTALRVATSWEMDVKATCLIIKTRSNVINKLMLVEMKEKMFLVSFGELNHSWGRKQYEEAV